MIAFVFPGQGSQKSGMGAAWISHPAFDLVREASEVLKRDFEYLLIKAPIEELTSTENAQMATFLQSLIVLDAAERMGFAPIAVAGHSLGEYTALVASGAISFEDGLKLVDVRGNAMKQATDAVKGSMAAVLGIDLTTAEIACSLAGLDCVVANDNSSSQIVISGPEDELDAAIQHLKRLGAKKAIKLQVGGAFHSRLMLPAKIPLIESLGSVEFRDAEIPVITNVDARPHTSGHDFFMLESAQITSKVRWRQTMETLSDMNITSLVELGPGSVLSGLAKREPCLKAVSAISIESPDDLDKLLHLTSSSIEVFEDSHKNEVLGEALHTKMRVILSPASGLFRGSDYFEFDNKNPNMPFEKILKNIVKIQVGDQIGSIDDTPVLSPFKGTLKGLLAIPLHRVERGEPLFWMLTSD